MKRKESLSTLYGAAKKTLKDLKELEARAPKWQDKNAYEQVRRVYQGAFDSLQRDYKAAGGKREIKLPKKI